jgi:putative acetyltransferase
MGVLPKAQVRGAARALINACVDRARAMRVPRMFLETNSVLGPALNLYRSAGFLDLSPECAEPSPYARCDVQMELRL